MAGSSSENYSPANASSGGTAGMMRVLSFSLFLSLSLFLTQIISKHGIHDKSLDVLLTSQISSNYIPPLPLSLTIKIRLWIAVSFYGLRSWIWFTLMRRLAYGFSWARPLCSIVCRTSVEWSWGSNILSLFDWDCDLPSNGDWNWKRCMMLVILPSILYCGWVSGSLSLLNWLLFNKTIS